MATSNIRKTNILLTFKEEPYLPAFNKATLKQIINIPLFYLQRERNRTNIDEIKEYYIRQVKLYDRIFFPFPFVVAQSESKNLSTKESDKKRSKMVLLDGQHRIQALKELFKDESQLFKDIKNQKEALRVLLVKTDNGARCAYCDIHRQKDLDLLYREEDEEKEEEKVKFNQPDPKINLLLEDFVNLIIKNLVEYKVNIVENPSKRHTFKKFYSGNFKKFLKNDAEFKNNRLSKTTITAKQLYESFTIFLLYESKIKSGSGRFVWFDGGQTGYRRKLKPHLKNNAIEDCICPIFLYHSKAYQNIITKFSNNFDNYKNKTFETDLIIKDLEEEELSDIDSDEEIKIPHADPSFFSKVFG